MLLTILGIVILMGGIVTTIICSKQWNDTGSLIGVIAIIIGGIMTAICVIAICCVQIPKEKNYQQALYEKEVIEYRITNQDKDIVGNELLYQDVVEYNRKLRNIKTYSKNIWVNWFYNDKIADIDYIEYKR